MSDENRIKKDDDEAAQKHFEEHFARLKETIKAGELTPHEKAEELIWYYFGSEGGEWRQSLPEIFRETIKRVEDLILELCLSVFSGSMNEDELAGHIQELTSEYQIPEEFRQIEQKERQKEFLRREEKIKELSGNIKQRRDKNP